MKALTWHGKSDMRCESVPDPRIEHPRDAIIKVTACAICGSDLHIFDGVIPACKAAMCSATRRWARLSRSAPRTRSMFEAYAKGGDNARMKQFASDMLPTLKMHLDQVGKLK